jgi:hypothetical protein
MSIEMRTLVILEKAGIHASITANSSSDRTTLPMMTDSCGGTMGPGLRRGDVY